jgi:uncharacterized membrane protein YhhN
MKRHIALLPLLFPLSLGIVATIQDSYDFVRTVTLLVLCLIITVCSIVWSRNSKRSDWFLASAYVFCICGDSFLFHRGDSVLCFVMGIVMFGLTHLNYLCLMLNNGRMSKTFGVIFTSLLLVYFATFLAPRNDLPLPLKIAVLVYLLLSCLTLSAAVGLRLPKPEKAVFILAISLMIFSDTTISFKEFLHWEKLNVLLMPTYYFSLIFMCIGMCLKLQRAAAERLLEDEIK